MIQWPPHLVMRPATHGPQALQIRSPEKCDWYLVDTVSHLDDSAVLRLLYSSTIGTVSKSPPTCRVSCVNTPQSRLGSWLGLLLFLLCVTSRARGDKYLLDRLVCLSSAMRCSSRVNNGGDTALGGKNMVRHFHFDMIKRNLTVSIPRRHHLLECRRSTHRRSERSSSCERVARSTSQYLLG